MSKITDIRDCKTVRDMDKYLVQHGYSKRQTGSSHVVYYGAGATISVPAHGELAPGTRRDIIKTYLGDMYYMEGKK